MPAVVGHLSPVQTRQGELLAHTNPDGSLVFSAVLTSRDWYATPRLPSPNALPTDTVTPARASQLWNPADRSVDVCILTPMETERCCPGLDYQLDRICSHSGHPQLCQIVVTWDAG